MWALKFDWVAVFFFFFASQFLSYILLTMPYSSDNSWTTLVRTRNFLSTEEEIGIHFFMLVRQVIALKDYYVVLARLFKVFFILIFFTFQWGFLFIFLCSSVEVVGFYHSTIKTSFHKRKWTFDQPLILNYCHQLEITKFANFSVNGDYSEWSSWSICSKTCGRGIKKRIRACNNPLPSNGGKDCYEQGLGPSEQRMHCFERSCPCKYLPGCHGNGFKKLRFLTCLYFFQWTEVTMIGQLGPRVQCPAVVE